MAKSKQLSYPSFHRYLKYQIVYLAYLEPDEVSRNHSSWLFYLVFLLVIVNYFRVLFIIFQSEVTNVSYIIADLTIPAGKTKKHLSLIFLSWVFGTFMCILTLYRSQYTPRLQKWTNIGVVFEHLSTRIHPISGLPTILHKFFIRFNLTVFYSASVVVTFLALPSFLIYPQNFLVYLWNWLPINIALGLVVVGYGANFGPLYAFQVYIFAKKMTDQKNNLTDRLNYTLTNYPSEQLTSLVNYSVQSSISIMKELIEGYHFWIHFNQSIFFATFMAQSIVLYIIFFVDIPQFLRLAMILLGFINWLSGLSVHFFLGTYGQRKIDQHRCQLKRTLYLNISNQMKVQLVNYLEHIESRYFFCIFGSLNYSLDHFLLVVLENAANLLLIISTLQ